MSGREAPSRSSLSRRGGGRLVTAWKWLTNTDGREGGRGHDYVNTGNNANRFEIASIIPQSSEWPIARRVAREENEAGGDQKTGSFPEESSFRGITAWK